MSRPARDGPKRGRKALIPQNNAQHLTRCQRLWRLIARSSVNCRFGMSPLRIGAKIGLIVFAIELAVMLVFELVSVPYLSPWQEALADALLLTLLSSPLIYSWVIKPYVAARNRKDGEARQANALLQVEIADRKLIEEQLREREIELERSLGELEFNRSIMEEQAANTVALAEQLALQKQELEQSKQQSDYLANYDSLTGLPNRRHFLRVLGESVAAAGRNEAGAALLFVDLDRFKAVNDSCGHDRGDQLLRDVAARLRSSVRQTDMVARLAGDEFVVLAAPVTGGDAPLRHLAERIRDALAISVTAPGEIIPVRASIGAACFPSDAADAEFLLQAADEAMYVAKERGRNCVVFFSDLSAVRRQAAAG